MLFRSQFIWLLILLYMAYTKIDLLLGYLKNSPAAFSRLHFRDGGPWGKVFVLTGLIGIVVNPQRFIRDGLVSSEDIKKIPAGLKSRITLMWRIGWGLLITLLVSGGIIKLVGL